MASGTTVFQTNVTATPPNGLPIMADSVNDSDHGVGTAQYIKIMDGATAGTAKAGVTAANGLAVDVTRVQGTIQSLGSVQGVGTFQVLGSVQGVGTFQMLGTLQPLAGSIHIASRVPGTVDIGTIAGTVSALGTFQPLAGSVHLASTGTLPLGTVQVLGSVQTVGTSQALGTVQPLAGSVHLASTGTLPLGTVQVLGTVQTHGTSQAIGTFQPLAGSVHIANGILGSVSAQGYVAHDSAAAGNPVLFGAFGSSGTQVAVNDGDMVRLWADLNGRLQIRGTIDSMPAISVSSGTIPGGTIQAFGTTEVLGTVRALTTVDVTVGTITEGTIQSFTGTAQVLGTVQVFGTAQVLGTFQPLAGSVHLASTGTLPLGTVQVLGSVQGVGTFQVLGSVQTVGTRQVLGTVRAAPILAAEGFFGTIFTGAVTNGTLVPAPSAGTYVRVWGMMVSGSAAGSAFIEFGNGTNYGQVFLAANGGFVYTSAKGIRTNGTAQDILFTCAAGSWGVSVEYTLEN